MNRIFNLFLIVGVILIILWVLGLVTSYSLGGYVHVMLVIALVCIVVWFIFGWRHR